MHFIDNINQIKDITNNTISENITYENIENKIVSKNFLKNKNANNDENILIYNNI